MKTPTLYPPETNSTEAIVQRAVNSAVELYERWVNLEPERMARQKCVFWIVNDDEFESDWWIDHAKAKLKDYPKIEVRVGSHTTPFSWRGHTGLYVVFKKSTLEAMHPEVLTGATMSMVSAIQALQTMPAHHQLIVSYEHRNRQEARRS